MAGNITPKEEKMMRVLLVLDTLRGEHSTGLAAIARYTDPLIAKSVGPAHDLFDTAQYTRAMARQNKVFIGHNRYATTGKINRASAHPFEFGDIIGAHNGTLTNKGGLDGGHNFEVDSQALYNHISKHGVQDAVNKVGGAWALTWWDGADKTLNVLRNKERPLYLAPSKDDKTVFWASEHWMLIVAANQAKVDIEDPWFLKEDLHLKLAVPNNIGDKLPNFETKEVKSSYAPFTPPATQYKGLVGSSTKPSGQTPPSTKTYVNGVLQTTTYPPSQMDKKKLPAATGETPVGAAAVIHNQNDTFSNKKDVVMLITGKGVDTNGSLYAIGDISDCPFRCRLYLKGPEEYDDIAGQKVMGNLGNLYRNPKEGYFYKMTYSSYQLVDNEGQMFESKDGKPLHKGEWIARYGSCCWCTGYVDPTQKHRFSRLSDEAVCSLCCDDHEVVTYV